MKWIETDFEAKHPDIDLVVRPLEKSYESMPDRYVGDLSYEVDKTIAALTAAGPDEQDLVEVDAVILGRLIAAGAVSPFHLTGPSFLPAAIEAVTFGDTVYGVPHWTCGYFVISEYQGITRARSLPALLQTLDAAGTERPNLVGGLDGSWDAIMVYLDALRDTDPHVDLRAALSRPSLASSVAEALPALGRACLDNGVNRCGGQWVELFAGGGADALIGYSERLHPILSASPTQARDLFIASAPLGSGDNPTLFVDALVRSPRCSSPECLDAARRFATYYVSDEVFGVVLMGADRGDHATPRYLLPATSTAFTTGGVAADRLYRQLYSEIAGARPFPSTGVPEAREAGEIRRLVKEALGLPD